MRILITMLALISIACGKPGGSTSTGGTTPPANPVTPGPATKNYVLRLTGNGAQFTALLITDKNTVNEQQVTVNPTVIPSGQQVDILITGYQLSEVQVSRMSNGTDVSGGGPWMVFTVYKNGTAGESSQLSTGGSFYNFISVPW